MELRQLKYFIKAAELLSFSEAARALNIAQSTLSQQVRQLEDELNIRLFDRQSNAISLTEAAVEILRKKGQAVAAKREDRQASEGCVLAANEGNFAAVVALKCETDFVAKNAGFVGLTKDILAAAVANKVKTIDELKALVINGQTIADLIVEESGKTGEKMELGAYECVEAPSVTSYNHLGNKLATIVGFNVEGVDFQVGRDVAMQVASMNPVAVDRDSVPQSVKDSEYNVAVEKDRKSVV